MYLLFQFQLLDIEDDEIVIDRVGIEQACGRIEIRMEENLFVLDLFAMGIGRHFLVRSIFLHE